MLSLFVFDRIKSFLSQVINKTYKFIRINSILAINAGNYNNKSFLFNAHPSGVYLIFATYLFNLMRMPTILALTWQDAGHLSWSLCHGTWLVLWFLTRITRLFPFSGNFPLICFHSVFLLPISIFLFDLRFQSGAPIFIQITAYKLWFLNIFRHVPIKSAFYIY